MQIPSIRHRQLSENATARSSQPQPRLLLIAGVLAATISFATDVAAGLMRPGYNFASQSSSVLTTLGASSRPFVVGLDLVANALVIAFAVGLWLTAGHKRSPRVIAGLVAGSAVLQSIAVVVFPFNPAGARDDFTNSLNVVLMAPTIGAWILAIVLGAVAYRNWFRFFSIGLLLAWLVEDVLATSGASLLVAGGVPGSLVGLQERSMGYGFWLWVALLAIVQFRAQSTKHA